MTQTRSRLKQVAAGNSESIMQRMHRPDYQIVLFVGLLMLIGLVMMYAIGPQRANVLNRVHNTDFYTNTYFVLKQAFSIGLGVIAFFAMSKIPFALLRRHALTMIYVGFGLSALLFIGGNLLKIDAIAVSTLGAYRWFNLGPLGTFQPAEVLKFALLIFIASFLGVKHREGKLNDLHETIYPAVGMTGLALFFVVILQKDMGTGLSIAGTVFAMLIVSGISWKILSRILLVGIVGVILLTVFVPHRRERLITFFDGDNHSSTEASNDENYHIKNAMIALGTGGMFGLGVGNSVQATGYLPEAVNDSVFAIIGETFGYIGAMVLVLMFFALLFRVLRTSEHLVDMPMRLVAAGVFGWLGTHVILNIASMIGLIPLTGITLPLLSAGGTSIVFIAGALGLVFQLSKFTSQNPVQIKEGPGESTMRRRGIGGSRNPGRRRYQ